jgi:type II secretory pathway component GspD/PulD (secretin)
MDNEQAKIIVGKNIPFPISTGRDSNNNPIVSYQREDVAITLQVTPQINESNYVTLELFQEVQEVEEGTENSDGGPTTTKRSAETVVVVQDNQTVVIGGLIGSTDTDIEQKIPILGDLPLVGNLFRSKQISSRKTNLLIFLTPHIVEKPEDLEEVYRVKMAQRDEYVRRFYGKSRDEQEDQIHDLLKYSVNHIDEPRSGARRSRTRRTTRSSARAASRAAPPRRRHVHGHDQGRHPEDPDETRRRQCARAR